MAYIARFNELAIFDNRHVYRFLVHRLHIFHAFHEAIDNSVYAFLAIYRLFRISVEFTDTPKPTRYCV